MKNRIWMPLIVTAVALATWGCHRPQGALLSYSGDASVYYSFETRPVTVELLDLRSEQVIFRMDVPAGKQLAIQFEERSGNDQIDAPDLMRYSVDDIGRTIGSLDNKLPVPTAQSRRLDVFYGDEIQYKSGDGPLPQTGDAGQPDWWTPEGGAAPPRANEAAITAYDG